MCLPEQPLGNLASQQLRLSGEGCLLVAQRSRILVVDDQSAVRNVVRLNLEFEGYQVSDACDADSGIAVARQTFPDLILLDIEMPSKTGWDVLAELRSDPALRDIPVVMLTGRADEISEWRAKDLGAVAYIAKPVGAADLVRTVAKLLQAIR